MLYLESSFLLFYGRLAALEVHACVAVKLSTYSERMCEIKTLNFTQIAAASTATRRPQAPTSVSTHMGRGSPVR